MKMFELVISVVGDDVLILVDTDATLLVQPTYISPSKKYYSLYRSVR